MILGPAGLAALKELKEAGFKVTLFERRHEVGGIWTWTEDRSMTTALKETQLCNSKFSVPMSDFPVPEGKSECITEKKLEGGSDRVHRISDLHDISRVRTVSQSLRKAF